MITLDLRVREGKKRLEGRERGEETDEKQGKGRVMGCLSVC